MKKRALCVSFVFGLAAAAFAVPAEGAWKTEADDGAYAFVETYTCETKACGGIARAFRAAGACRLPKPGKRIVIDMRSNGDGGYDAQVRRPSNDRIHIGEMSLSGDRIRLRGCVAGGLACSSQNWARVI